MTLNKNLFTRLNKQITTVIVANEVKLRFPRRKNIVIKLDNHLVTMTNVLYISKFSCNVLSIFALKEKNIEVHFRLNNIILIRNDTPVATGTLRGRMYYLESASGQQALASQDGLTSPTAPAVAAPAVAAPNSARQSENSDIRPKEVNEYLKWHARMGHAGPDRLLKTIQAVNGISKDIEVDKNKCVTCILSKMMRVVNRLPFLKTSNPLKRVFFDFWKKYRVAGIKNKKHFLFFMNDYTKMSVIYICDKSETRQQLNAYKNRMKKQIEKIFQRIRNNNAKKYLMMKTLLKQQKIHFKTITTYTSEQNGVIERLNRILMTAAKEMLL